MRKISAIMKDKSFDAHGQWITFWHTSSKKMKSSSISDIVFDNAVSIKHELENVSNLLFVIAKDFFLGVVILIVTLSQRSDEI